MAKITEKYNQSDDRMLFLCDFSPPRGSSVELLESAKHLDVDWISVAYNPGKSTRINSAMAAHWIKTNTDRDAVFCLCRRTMGRMGRLGRFRRHKGV